MINHCYSKDIAAKEFGFADNLSEEDKEKIAENFLKTEIYFETLNVKAIIEDEAIPVIFLVGNTNF